MSKFNVIILLSLIMSACGRESSQPVTPSIATASSARPVDAREDQALSMPVLTVHKNASCGCCEAWVKHMQAHGFPVTVNDVDNMQSIKERVGIPPAMGSCHTGEVGGYFIEGHVPAEDVKRLLAEHPDAKGLTVPRMPVGSPGMEMPSGKVELYDVYLVANDGTTSVYAHHGDQGSR